MASAEVDDVAIAAIAHILAEKKPTKDRCLEWDGSIDKYGYGRIWVGGKEEGREYRVHRLSVCAVEKMPYAEIDGWLVRHMCNNRKCFNPAHLLLGDDKQNVLDKVFAGRTNRQKGETNGRAKLTDEQVSDIRVLAHRGLSQSEIGRIYGVSAMQISRIVNYKQRA
jgi:hypothetical protein